MIRVVQALGLALILTLPSCFTGQQITELDPGMTKQEVIDLLGRPDGFRSSGEYEALTYTHRMMSGWTFDRADYIVILRDGLVVEYGAGEVRQSKNVSGAFVIFPGPSP
ncbi:MAG: hypothetical protein DWP92_09900 [Armatimonadetes bacterium]|nr:MAG: hypothetical protein DWP92_09900 [Armatimonadota bacterium]